MKVVLVITVITQGDFVALEIIKQVYDHLVFGCNCLNSLDFILVITVMNHYHYSFQVFISSWVFS